MKPLINNNLYHLPSDGSGNKKVDADYVLKESNGGLNFFQLILGPLEKQTEERFLNVRNPFYNDKNPGLSVFYDFERKRWKFNDYGDAEYRGDAFDFCAIYFKLKVKSDFPQLLEKMIELLESKKVELSDDYKTPEKTEREERPFTLKERGLNNLPPLEIEFLEQYQINKEDLNITNVRFIDGYSSNIGLPNFKERTKSHNQIMMAIKGDGFAKIYQTNPKGFFYLGNKPNEYVFGMNYFEEYNITNDLVIITGGEKDALVLNGLGYIAISLSSETATSIPERVLSELQFRFQKIAVLYDNDETGIKQSLALAKKYSLYRITLPNELKDKGGKDVADYVKLKLPLEVLHSIIAKSVADNIEENKPEIFPSVIASSDQSLKLISHDGSFRTANQRLEDAKNMPPITPLFGVFWHTNELSILFGDTGIGKSILAVSIADKISRGEKLMFLNNDNSPLKVLYLDFELSDKQFEKRYSGDNGELYKFSENFYNDYINFHELKASDIKRPFDELLFDKMCELIDKTEAKVLILDNITYLKMESTQDAKIALDIMNRLNDIKKKQGVSILVLAHTPKLYKSNPISINDLAGSKHISNFADNVFTIGMSSKDKNLRYIKQIKARSAEMIYGQDNVIVCELAKKENFLSFEFLEFDNETNHLSQQDKGSESALIEEAKKLQKEGNTIQKVANKLGLSKSKVGRWLKPD